MRSFAAGIDSGSPPLPCDLACPWQVAQFAAKIGFACGCATSLPEALARVMIRMVALGRPDGPKLSVEREKAKDVAVGVTAAVAAAKKATYSVPSDGRWSRCCWPPAPVWKLQRSCRCARRVPEGRAVAAERRQVAGRSSLTGVTQLRPAFCRRSSLRTSTAVKKPASSTERQRCRRLGSAG